MLRSKDILFFYYKSKYERKEKERRIAESPGGLDPCEVMESLPEPMRTAFESRDIPALQEAVKHMEEHEFKYHLDRCIKSGLWVPGPEDSKDQRPAETLASVNQEP
ncbi:hypothetical protein Zmor_024820 [Zophobas morio]|uniref:Cdc37 C-terminal domain-containing protein n=1 Tax=Zophobas morio TaxID=2755281 RepID=A0AA38M1C7_9CUCU|nr:hypothetical protein Zmor_024820 [Zophobas morio]